MTKTYFNEKINWSTGKEIKFLEGLGTWRDRGSSIEKVKDRRLNLLKKYEDSMKDRKRWGKIDPIEIKKKISDFANCS